MAYSGNTVVISGLKQQNNLSFPLVKAADVYVDDDTRLDAKLDELAQTQGSAELISGETIKTINGNSIVGSGNLVIGGPDGDGSIGYWADIADKPFDSIGAGLKVVGSQLTVDTANAVEQDNTKPVTSAAVHTEIGNIEALLRAL